MATFQVKVRVTYPLDFEFYLNSNNEGDAMDHACEKALEEITSKKVADSSVEVEVEEIKRVH